MNAHEFNPRLLHINHQGHCTHGLDLGPFPARTTRWHELDIVTLGGGRDVVNGVEYKVRTGDVFYRPSGVHNQHFQPYYCYFFIFDPVYAPAHEAEYLKDKYDTGLDALQAPWEPIPPFAFSSGPHLGKLTNIEPVFHLANRILAESERQGGGDALLIKSLMLSLFNELHWQLLSHPVAPPKDGRYSQYVNLINDLRYYVRNHPSEDFTVARLAEMAQLSPNFLSRIFHAIVGQTPLRFIHQVKINYIKTLLLDTEMRVTEVAAHAGFDDPTYMYSLFKRYTKTTPTAYRRAMISREAADGAQEGIARYG